jgi:hypothetical protein
MSAINLTLPPLQPDKQRGPVVLPSIKTINTWLPTELLRDILLYSIESNLMKPGQLASVCRRWRSAITTMAHLWSTLRVGSHTETEQVSTWLQRAFPKKVVIDTERDREGRSKTPAFAALLNALMSTDQWHELTISSFPPETMASWLGIQVASPMNALNVVHVAVGCVRSLSLAHLLNLVPTSAPLSELLLHSRFASTHFLQPHWFPILKSLTVLIVNGRDIHEPFELLPAFTQLRILEADRLRLPFYEPSTNLPLLGTLQKLQLRACSVQWMAGRQFPFLEECAILLPRNWEVIQRHEVQLPSCRKLAYHGYPMTTARYFHVPEMRAMDLRSHDCNDQRIHQQLRYLCRVDGRISNLTTLHLTFQCSEQVLTEVLKYLVPLQELVLSIAHPSPSWQTFLESLAAKPSTNEWPACETRVNFYQHCVQWCSSQTWQADVLPHLKFLGIQCPKGFSQSECLDNFPLFRLVGWTRSYMAPPLEHLKVWEGRGSTDDITVDYIATGYQDKHIGISSKDYDAMIVTGMVTRRLVIHDSATPLFVLHSTVLFRQLQDLELSFYRNHEIPILPYLEQIKKLKISRGTIPEYSSNIDLPLTHTLQLLQLRESTFSWMFRRTFKALRELSFDSLFAHEILSMYAGWQVDLPACTTLQLWDCHMDHLRFLSCSNVQLLFWSQFSAGATLDLTALHSLHDFVIIHSCLQYLFICIPETLEMDSLIQFVFCGAWEKGAWRNIRNVIVTIEFSTLLEASHFSDQTVGHQQRYEKWWKTFTVTNKEKKVEVIAFT